MKSWRRPRSSTASRRRGGRRCRSARRRSFLVGGRSRHHHHQRASTTAPKARARPRAARGSARILVYRNGPRACASSSAGPRAARGRVVPDCPPIHSNKIPVVSDARRRRKRGICEERIYARRGKMLNAVEFAARDLRYVMRKGERLSADRLLVVRQADIALRHVLAVFVEVDVAHEVVG